MLAFDRPYKSTVPLPWSAQVMSKRFISDRGCISGGGGVPRSVKVSPDDVEGALFTYPGQFFFRRLMK